MIYNTKDFHLDLREQKKHMKPSLDEYEQQNKTNVENTAVKNNLLLHKENSLREGDHSIQICLNVGWCFFFFR